MKINSESNVITYQKKQENQLYTRCFFKKIYKIDKTLGRLTKTLWKKWRRH